ncbi:hypothetical protein M0802_007360 [Mischocyttarus mexicanus]|nr:hypothetical protein M0802_007360 [Mischocyttarus mexicanus]
MIRRSVEPSDSTTATINLGRLNRSHDSGPRKSVKTHCVNAPSTLRFVLCEALILIEVSSNYEFVPTSKRFRRNSDLGISDL